MLMGVEGVVVPIVATSRKIMMANIGPMMPDIISDFRHRPLSQKIAAIQIRSHLEMVLEKDILI